MAIKKVKDNKKSFNLKKAILGISAAAGFAGAGLVNAGSANADTIYTVQKGDTLSSIAQKVLGDANKYKEIASNNKLSDPNVLSVGEQLDISNNGKITPLVNSAISANESNKQQITIQSQSQNKNNTSAKQVVPQVNYAKSNSSNSYQQVKPQISYAKSNSNNSYQQVKPQVSYAAASESYQAPVAGNGSTYSQFIAAGGTPELWNSIVMPESGGNPNAVNGRYHGIGQTSESWGSGSVADQTKGMINYCNSRYGSVSGAIAFRNAHGWY